MRWAKIKLTTNSRITPALAKTWAAMAIRALAGYAAHTMRRTLAIIRAIQKPNRRAERMNLCERRLFNWKMVMLRAAPVTNKPSSTPLIGSSTDGVGLPPRPAVVGRYGGPCPHVSPGSDRLSLTIRGKRAHSLRRHPAALALTLL